MSTSPDTRPISSRSPGQQIAIIGMGCVFPKAPDHDTFWANIRDGVDAIGEVPSTHWDPEQLYDPDPTAPDKTYARRGGFIDAIDFSPLEFGIAPRDLEATDTTQLLGLHVAAAALADAGYGKGGRAFDRARTSVVLGVTGALELVISLGARLGHPKWRRALAEAGVDEALSEDIISRISDQYVPWQENSFPGLLGNVAAGRIANRLDLHGTNCAVDAACASSLSALHLGMLELEAGRSDLVLAGGLDTFNDIFMYTCFAKTPALSPTGDVRPFGKQADGTILGEGLGIVAIKRLDDALGDGDRIYAVVQGLGSASDGKGKAIYAPDAEGQARALRSAYRLAGIDPRTVELLEGHGTGTKVGDATELEGLRKVYGEASEPWCALGSVKSMIGHTKAAAGVAGLIKAALALHHKVLPPTIKADEPADAVAQAGSPFYLSTEKRPWLAREGHPRRAAVSAFGFGGSNFHCVLEEAPKAKAKVGTAWDGQTQLLAFSAETRPVLAKRLRSFAVPPRADALRDAAAATRVAFTSNAAVRVTVAVTQDGPTGGLAALLDQAAALVESDKRSRFTTPTGIAFGEGPAGDLAVLFPGQGAQYPGMLGDLACQIPEFGRVVAEACAEVEGLGARLYPAPGGAQPQQAADLRATEFAQPALGAVSLGALRVLEGFGVEFAATAGHSYGELVALVAAGRLPAAELPALSQRRGALMAAGSGDRGAMLAVTATLTELEAWLGSSGLPLTIANRNAPNQHVLSGATEAIAAAKQALDAQGLRCTPLQVAAAFHSPLVADAQGPLAEALRAIDLKPGRVPVFANTTAAVYPSDSEAAKALLAGQLAAPVEFVRSIEAMHAAGVRTFVEVGPGRRLTGLVARILGDRADAVALDASAGKRAGMLDLGRTLGTIAAFGHAVDLSRWDPKVAPVQGGKRVLTVPVCGAHPRPKRTVRPPLARAATVAPTPPCADLQPISAPPAAPTAMASANSQPPHPAVPAASVSPGAVNANLSALLQLQQQTADLHRQFLDGQEAATRALGALLAQGQMTSVPVPVPMPVAASVPVAAPVPAPAPVPAVQVPAPRIASAPQDIAEVLLAIVADKTGYPREMLELSMGLDADLGIDSIKRVEILSALSERLPELPAIGPEQLGRLQTLGQIAEHLQAGAGTSAAVPPVSAVPATAPDQDIAEILLGIVADKTGYPRDMLELGMGLDADLGIDSIKRVEILSALSERLPQLPAVGPEQLGRLQTLGQIADHLQAGAGSQAAVVGSAPIPVANTASPTAADLPAAQEIATVLLSVVADKTGYPTDMLELDMGLDADLGIDSIKRVEILSALSERLPAAGQIGPEQLGQLQTLREIANFLADTGPSVAAPIATPPQQTAPIAAPVSEAPLLRFEVTTEPCAAPTPSTLQLPQELGPVLVLGDLRVGNELCPALERMGGSIVRVEAGYEHPGPISGLVVLSPAHCDDVFVAAAFEFVRAHAARMTAPGAARVFVTLSRMDGAFALDGLANVAAARGGGLAGLTKTVQLEWPAVRCRAFDAAPGLTDTDIASRMAAHIACESSPLEVGLGLDATVTTTLRAVAPSQAVGAKFTRKDVVLVSGGARGVTADVAIAIATAGAGTLVLLGRSPAPEAEPSVLLGITDEATLKGHLLALAQTRCSPKELQRAYAKLCAAREIRTTLARIKGFGGRGSYRQVDVRDQAQVADVVNSVTTEFGPVTALVHGAGVLADRRLEDKQPEDFDRVYGTKVEGLQHLLDALRESPLAAVVLFSSSTARFGRVAQSDYAVANEVLNKLAQAERSRRPDARVLAIGWGPWDGGMVTPGLRKMFAAEGIEVIGRAAGAKLVLEALACAGSAELVVLGGGSHLPAGTTTTGSAGPTPQAVAPVPQAGPPELPTVFERTLSVASHQVLSSHVLGERAVLPTVMMVEWFAHAALHGNPGLGFAGFNDLRVFKGVTLGRDESLDIRICAGDRNKNAQGEHVVQVQLCSGGSNGHRVVHASAEVLVGDLQANSNPNVTSPPTPEFASFGTPVASLYDRALFHGPRLQGLLGIDSLDKQGLVARYKPAPAPAQWMQSPVRGRWLADPMALDCAMQAMIVWTTEVAGSPSLPSRLGRYRQFARFPKQDARMVIRVTSSGPNHARADIDWLDPQGRLVAQLQDYECTSDAALRHAFARNSLGGAA